jgi:hypothetical protein
MKRIASVLLLFTAGFCGCSRPDAADSASPQVPVTPTPTNPNAALPAQGQSRDAHLESTVGTALNQQNYDAAVTALAQANGSLPSASEAQRLQYNRQLQLTLEALQRAKDADPKARAAYERLGRMATGR